MRTSVGDRRLALGGPARPLAQRRAADVRARPEHDLRVAVLAHDLRVHRMRIDAQLVAEHLPQSRGVQHGAGAHHALGGKPRALGDDVREHVHRVGDHDDEPAIAAQLRAELAHRLRVVAQEVEPRLVRLAAPAGGDHQRVGRPACRRPAPRAPTPSCRTRHRARGPSPRPRRPRAARRRAAARWRLRRAGSRSRRSRPTQPVPTTPTEIGISQRAPIAQRIPPAR